MTFTEAAVEVLKREGKPLHFRKIAEIAIREGLLDHVGKIPEETMADQLAAHCRLPRPDRRVLVVQSGTFALEDWGLAEDPTGLDNLVEPHPEEELPYRSRERHPIPARDLARSVGRESGRGRRREEGEERRHRFPPPAEVAYEILAGAERPLSLRDLASLGVERSLMPDAFLREVDSLAAALREDNRRRAGSGRTALFALQGEMVTLEAQPEPGERPAPLAVPRLSAGPEEVRRAALAAVRRRLRACDAATMEWLAARLLEKMELRELKVAKRGREHVVFTGRRRMGLTEVRHCIRVLRSGADVGRRDVSELRRDLGHYGAQMGMLVTAGDAGRDARGEASAANQMPVLLIAGEAFAEAFADAGVACRLVTVPEPDESFLAQAAEAAQREESARRSRREERERRDERERGEGRREGREEEPPEGPRALEGPAPAEAPAPAPEQARAEALPEPPSADEEGEEGEDEDVDAPEGSEQEVGTEAKADVSREAGERRRRRRRRRRRGGRGRGERRPEGEGAPPAGAPASEASAAPVAPAEAPPETAPPAQSREGGEPG